MPLRGTRCLVVELNIMVRHGVNIDPLTLRDFCERHGIARLSLFGSIIRHDFRPDSDVDVLIEFPPGCTPSLLRLGGMQVELSQLMGRSVDLKTPGFLSRYFRDEVLRNAEVQYAG